jgi:hypothetical protein
MAGVYETYDGEVVTLLDERDAACPDPMHVEGNAVPAAPASTSSAPPSHPRVRR